MSTASGIGRDSDMRANSASWRPRFKGGFGRFKSRSSRSLAQRQGSERKPWYQEKAPSTLISLFALVTAIIVACLNYRQGQRADRLEHAQGQRDQIQEQRADRLEQLTRDQEQRAQVQERHSRRSELSDLVMRLLAIPREQLEFRLKYGQNGDFDSIKRLEITTLAKRASDIVLREPDNFGTYEFLVVGLALIDAREIDLAKKMMMRVADQADRMDEKYIAKKSLAQIAMELGETNSADQLFRDALVTISEAPKATATKTQRELARLDVLTTWAGATETQREPELQDICGYTNKALSRLLELQPLLEKSYRKELDESPCPHDLDYRVEW